MRHAVLGEREVGAFALGLQGAHTAHDELQSESCQLEHGLKCASSQCCPCRVSLQMHAAASQTRQVLAAEHVRGAAQ